MGNNNNIGIYHRNTCKSLSGHSIPKTPTIQGGRGQKTCTLSAQLWSVRETLLPLEYQYDIVLTLLESCALDKTLPLIHGALTEIGNSRPLPLVMVHPSGGTAAD